LGPAGAAELDRIVFELPRTILAADTFDSYQGLARTVLSDGRADVVGVGLLLSLWTGSRALNRYLSTIVIAYDVTVTRPSWKRRLLALGLTVGGLAGTIALLPMLVLGPHLVRLVAPGGVAAAVLDAAGWFYWPTVAGVVLIALTTLYHVAVPWRTPWLRDLPGAALAMLLWMASAAGLRAYLALSASDNAVYQQLGTPIAFVLWLYVSAIAVLLGAELNAEIERTWPSTSRDTPPTG
ncbi:MAG TPA: YihY/virulence factor BrkB family protein, partial [Nocardioidaceae bacterium]|nr:YihY/virulence factor BrkB family protein [Nocardioidaceae bacterium]